MSATESFAELTDRLRRERETRGRVRLAREKKDALDEKHRLAEWARIDAQGLHAILKYLGFSSYNSYLNSKLWRRIRLAVLRAAKHTCRFCGKRAWQVHHGKYTVANLSGASLEHLFAACRTCHDQQHLSPLPQIEHKD